MELIVRAPSMSPIDYHGRNRVSGDRSPFPLAATLFLFLSALATSPGYAGPFCFRGRPLPDCGSFLLTEVTYAKRLNNSSGDGTHSATGEFGWMRNRSERWALGAAAFIGIRGHYSTEVRVGPEVRLRRWLADGRSLDISSGMLVGGGSTGTRIGGFGQLSYNMGDRFHLTSRWEYARFPGYPPETPFGWYLGAGLGSKTALIVGGSVGVLLALTGLALHD